jgi:uncharacterized membrane protein
MMIEGHDHSRIDRWVHLVLRGGMAISLSVLLIGLFMYALDPSGAGNVTLSLEEVLSGLAAGEPIAVISLGILLLIATPFSRVVTAMGVFVVDREPRFIAVSVLVIAAIAVAVLLG